MSPARVVEIYRIASLMKQGKGDLSSVTPHEIMVLAETVRAVEEDDRKAAASLALLNDPREGLIVEGEGFELEFEPWGMGLTGGVKWRLINVDSLPVTVLNEDGWKLLRALVSCGGATVRLPDGEVGS